jgi:hypothetical protein
MKKWFSVAVLVVSSLGLLSAKSYQITLTSPAKVGTLQLKAGQYSIKVDGSNAIFTDDHNKKFTIPVKVGKGEKKFETTRVESVKDGDADRLNAIDLAGSETVLAF